MEIGCNYIEKIRPVDHVCAFDIDVALKLKLKPNIQYHTRPQSTLPGWNIINDTRTDGGNSGVLACLVASQLPKQPIYIIGCDWGLTDDSSDDRIYKKGPRRKYTNNIKKATASILNGTEVWIVNNRKPDVPFNIISVDDFLSKINNNTQGRTL